ncbi:alpha/beta fold hydrolase [Austwickia chelonae]|uniref:alpha/beta fold hydrolase n=1 Tax=Austwickia chelonae TaxID=100225 RepID=UPI000E2830AC|nr:alpha/beta fold hydrolase [Austwickia chelonae]
MRRPPFFLFVHDLGQTPLQWEEQVAALPSGVGAACPWLRGTRPGGKTVEFTIGDAATSLITALDENGVASATLVGAGFGGTIALHAAARFPERVVAVHAISAPLQLSKKQLALQRTALRFMSRRSLAARNIDKDRLLAALAGAADGLTSDDLRGLEVPVTLITGADDKPGMLSARSLASVLPQARIEALAGRTGDLPTAASAEVNAVIFAGVDPVDPDQVDDSPIAPWDLS